VLLARAIFIFLLSFSSVPCFAFDLGPISNAIVAPFTAPIEVPRRIIRGDNPRDVLHDQFRQQGNAVADVANRVQELQNFISQTPRSTIEQVLGREWVDAYDLISGSQRVQTELVTTAGRYLGHCIRGSPCGINELAALPLAAMLRDAHKVYSSYAQPLPDQAVQYFANFIPVELLRYARVVIGSTPNYTIPGFLNTAHSWAGAGHAVTVGNIMIFSRGLNFSRCSDVIWFLHELKHVHQYVSINSDHILEAIDGFSVQYLKKLEIYGKRGCTNRTRIL
jgi:hypothetical protein